MPEENNERPAKHGLLTEVVGAVIAIALTTVVFNLWNTVDANKTVGQKNKDDIAKSIEVGDAEIKRSTAIDVQGEKERAENKLELKEMDDFLHKVDKEVGSLHTAVKYIHGQGELAHPPRTPHHKAEAGK